MNPPKDPSPLAPAPDTAATIDIHDGQPPPRVLVEEEEEPPLKPGALLVGRYTTLNQLGRGGMGVVYAVYDAKLDRRVALKLLRRRYDNPASTSGHARLLREAKAMARLNHPNVVSVYDVGTSDEGDVFVAMELVEGQTLTEWLRGGRRSWQEILAAFVAAGRGLAAAHAAGMIHRDFKTDNVLMGRDGRARVTDFGIVRLDLEGEDATPSATPSNDTPAPNSAAQRTPTAPTRPNAPARASVPSVTEPVSTSVTRTPTAPTNIVAPLPARVIGGDETTRQLSTGHTQLTQAGMVPGTPRYMAPEIFDLKPADSRSDLFSFCVALYEALARVHPFVDKSAAKDMKRAPEPATGGAGAPAWVLRAVESGLERDPQRRPPSMDALLDTLAPPARPERGRWIAVALGVAVMVSAGAALSINWRARSLERAQLCQGGPARLAGVWDSGAKQRVRAAFVATGQPYAEDVWTSVERSLDRYAAQWTGMYHESCAATRLRGEQTDAVMTVRMACLDRKLQSMSALVEVLGQADSAMLEKAPSAAAGLGSLAPCADVSGLLAAVPPPSDPALRAKLGEIHARLSRASALGLANRSAEAARAASLAVEEARATHERSILAEALATDGELRRTVEPARAVPVLEEAFWQAFAARLDRVAVAAAIHLTHAHYLLSQPAEAMIWQKHAQAGLERLDGDDELEAELWSVLGFGFDQRGNYDEALDAYRRAAVLCERRFGVDDLRTLRAQNEVLGALSNDNRVLEALPLAVSLLARQETLLGHGHPIVGRSLEELGAYEVLTGHLPQAREHMAEAEQLFRQAGAVGSRYWMALRSYQTWLAVHQGRMADAESTAHEVLALLDKASMQQSEEALELQAHLARAEIGLGHADRAVATLRRAIDAAEKTAGQATPMVASMLGALADAYAEQGRTVEAQRAAEQNLAIAVKQAGAGGVETAEARAALARVLVARPSEAARALALIDQSQPVLERVVGAQAPPVIAARRARGQALIALGRSGEAAIELRAALAAATRAELDPRLRQAIEKWLQRAEAAQSSAANRHAAP